jgi:hypothetical protein
LRPLRFVPHNSLAHLHTELVLRMSHGITNRRGRRGHRVIRVWESFCVSPKYMAIATDVYFEKETSAMFFFK